MRYNIRNDNGDCGTVDTLLQVFIALSAFSPNGLEIQEGVVATFENVGSLLGAYGVCDIHMTGCKAFWTIREAS